MNNNTIIAILTKSKIKASKSIIKTLDGLNLKYMHNMIFVPESESYKGMLRKTRNHVAWSIVPNELAQSISPNNSIVYCNAPYKGYVKNSKRFGYFDLNEFTDLILNKFIYRRKSKQKAQVS
jgi:ribosomal protein L30/L7E